jgi:hypothetical protein
VDEGECVEGDGERVDVENVVGESVKAVDSSFSRQKPN